MCDIDNKYYLVDMAEMVLSGELLMEDAARMAEEKELLEDFKQCLYITKRQREE